LQCPNCGVEVRGGAESCPACGEPIPDPSSSRQNVASPAVGFGAARRPVAYAGFWLRALAYVIDSLLLGIVLGIAILKPMMDHAGIPMDNPWVLLTGSSRQIAAINIALLAAAWVYWALMESSRWQATIGKKLLGLRVTDLQGQRIGFGRASGRHWAKLISNLTLLMGYAMAGFTEKKQALHDMIARCLVLKGR